MFSHLRIHRRGQSNPTSPNPDLPSAPSPWDPSLSHHHQHSPFLQDAALSPGTRPQPSTSPNSSSSLPPTLPPITRVTSSGSEFALDRPTPEATTPQEPAFQRPNPPPPPSAPPSARSPYNPDSGFLGGVALRKYEREQQLKQQQQQQQQQQQMAAKSPDPAALSPVANASHEFKFTKSKTAPPPTTTAPPAARSSPQFTKSSKHASSFATPTELQHQGHPQSSPQLPAQPTAAAATGRRPTGARLSSEPARLANHTPDAPKGRKGLPFLKNPMSTLLARRKTSQNAPDLTPLPLGGNRLAEPTYDPRIRGTRVHDFSAPRPRRSLPNNEGPSPAPAPTPVFTSVSRSQPPPAYDEKLDLDLGLTSSRESAAPAPAPAQQAFQNGRNTSSASESGRSGSVSIISQPVPESRSGSVKARASLNLDSKPLPEVPLRDDSATSSSSASVVSKRPSVGAASFMSKKAPSTRAPPSRHVSMSGGQDILSSVPRHMKSTSSRFSFDMAGAAKQERLLEERHRQRELERKTSNPEPSQNRDSRFDDFDDDFDYDAMMEDDGFEEPIPMSNDFEDDYYAYEEDFDAAGTDPLGGGLGAAGTGLDTVPEVEVEAAEDEDAEDDPDNDQENFAGFVFQRSNPPSALASPRSAGFVSTPRDADGRVIGFAYSESPNPDQLSTPGLPLDYDASSVATESVTGLAIEGLDIASPGLQDEAACQHTRLAPPPPPRAPPGKDDLYFDNGLLDELEFAGEGDGSHFDESIFDLDDTDQYGRPIPGAFAAAQAARAATAAAANPENGAPDNSTQNHDDQDGAAPESSKRISDSTSRLSAQSNMSQSTAHTSLSAGMPAPSAEDSKRASDVLAQGQESPAMTSSFSTTGPDKVEAYQDALAAAAFEAAANGRFRRDSSPPPSEIMSPGGGGGGSLHDAAREEDSNYDDNKNSNSFHDNYDNYDDYDDYDGGGGFREDLDDYDVDYDDFIAEANASALANDSDGWYGQEFGFYSAPIEGGGGGRHHSRDGSGGSDEKPFQYANGGFFGPSGVVSRSKSGRIVSREPNLTPITERSEYSNRNSIMSLALPLGSAGGPSSLQSPGLAQLAMMADGSDDSMSLSALMRLRSRAWGGSQASLVSSREGSPRSERGEGGSSPWGPGHNSSGSNGNISINGNNMLGIHGHARKSSSFSVRSRDVDSSDAGSTAGSPTMTMSMPTSIGSPPPPLPLSLSQSPAVTIASPNFTHSAAAFDPVPESNEMDEVSISNGISHSGLWMKSPDADVHPNLVPRTDPTSPRQQQQPQPGIGHKHKGSADSISYVKEGEEGGETRWVLERRFTADSGEIEVQREVVGKGHI
ncbi:hypothetical protein LX36DRAFT_214391 [Colletotrichum falcatum]|nr:hypothetical protein LX36DRAFT_214391 [Colletotrichum falcatum]